jgi:hypothetical protein
MERPARVSRAGERAEGDSEKMDLDGHVRPLNSVDRCFPLGKAAQR